jgi:hypothetical protein
MEAQVMSRWRQISCTTTEPTDGFYSVTFDLMNADTEARVVLSLVQATSGPAVDLIDACRAVTYIISKAAGNDAPLPGVSREKLN